MALDFSSLRSALDSLESALLITQSDEFRHFSPDLQNLAIAGAIQNFEFCFELGWKMLKRQLEHELANADELDTMSFKALIRVGAERGLIDEPDAWFTYRLMRNLTSHTYKADKAREVYAGLEAFAQSCQRLLTQLEAREA